MIPIDIAITENPIKDAAMPPLLSLRSVADVTKLTFTKRAQGGDISASLDLECDEETAFRFLGEYLGKRVCLVHPDAEYQDMNLTGILWQGFIYNAAIDAGGVSISQSLANFYNRVQVSYSLLNVSGGAVGSGTPKITAVVNDLNAQLAHGVRHLISPQSTLTDNEATGLRDILLNLLKQPEPNVVSSNSSGGLRVSVDCVGPWELLDKRFWSNTTTATAQLDVIVKAISATITGSNQFLSSNDTFMQVNTLTRTQYFSPDNPVTAQDAINLLCALGDVFANFKWIFGVRPDRKRYYRPITYNPKYLTYRKDPLGRILDQTTGEFVPPYLVEPGHLMFIPDLVPEGVVYSSNLLAARYQMLDEVVFTAPDSVAWRPQNVADYINLQTLRLGEGYHQDLYLPNLPEAQS